jgi:UDP-glucose 4-epimerase
LKGKQVLVTGGAGFIGSHVTRTLLERGAQVRVFDNLATGFQANLGPVAERIDFREQDLRDSEACMQACAGVDTVFHLGALGSVPRSIDDPLTSNAVNVAGTLNLLVAAQRQGVRRVVMSSSSSVYGDTPVLPKHIEMRPSPRSPYAVSKLAGEEYCRAFWHSYGLETVVLRYFNVFGPRQNPNSQYAAVIPRFISALLEGRRPVIYGDGTQSRDFTYVSNVVDANLRAATKEGVGGEVFNIACGGEIVLRDVLSHIERLLERSVEPEFLPARTGDVRHSRADIEPARQRLGYEPLVSFEDGIAETVRYFLSVHESSRTGGTPAPIGA